MSTDLTFVSTDELLDELAGRFSCFVGAGLQTATSEGDEVKFFIGKCDTTSVGLAWRLHDLVKNHIRAGMVIHEQPEDDEEEEDG